MENTIKAYTAVRYIKQGVGLIESDYVVNGLSKTGNTYKVQHKLGGRIYYIKKEEINSYNLQYCGRKSPPLLLFSGSYECEKANKIFIEAQIERWKAKIVLLKASIEIWESELTNLENGLRSVQIIH